MAMRKQGPRLNDDPRIHQRDESPDLFFGPAVRSTNRPDYFSIRSKLAPALIMFSAFALFIALLVVDVPAKSPFRIVFLVFLIVIVLALFRVYMGVVFDFFPDGVHSHIPELFIDHPFYFIFDFIEKKRNRQGESGFHLRKVDRARLHAVQAHTFFGWTFLLISLDEVRVGRLWWLSALCHPRRIMTLLLRQKDAQKALPLLQNYILFPNA